MYDMSPDSADFTSYVANGPVASSAPKETFYDAEAPEMSMSGDEDLGAYAEEAGIQFFGRRRSSFGAYRRKKSKKPKKSSRRKVTRRRTTRKKVTRRKTTRRKVTRRRIPRSYYKVPPRGCTSEKSRSACSSRPFCKWSKNSCKKKSWRSKKLKRYNRDPGNACSMMRRTQCEASSMCRYVSGRGCRRKKVRETDAGYSMKSMDEDDNLAAYDAEAGFTWMGRKKCPKGKRGAKCRKMLKKYRAKMSKRSRMSRKSRKSKKSRKSRKSGFGRVCKKIPRSLVKKARKLGIKTTKKVGSRRVPKTLKVLRKQIARKMR
jgi:hypothetical protein